MNDVWEFDVSKEKWRELKCNGHPPHPRASHGAVLLDDKLYVCGGVSGSSKWSMPLESHSDLYQLDLKNLKWTQVEIFGDTPPPVYAHMTGGFTEAGAPRVFTFGGVANESSINDLYDFRVPTSLKNYVFDFRKEMTVCFRLQDVKLHCAT